MLSKSNSAFSLIEMLIVVVIIGILATIASSGYRHYVIKNKVSEQYGYARSSQVAIEAFYNASRHFPTPNDLNGKSDSGSNSGEIGVNNGRFKIHYTKHSSADRALLKIERIDKSIGCDDNSCSIYIAGKVKDYKSIKWYCGQWDNPDSDNTHVNIKYIPSSCNSIISSCFNSGECV